MKNPSRGLQDDVGRHAFLGRFFFFFFFLVAGAAATGASESGTDRKSGHDGESKSEFNHSKGDHCPEIRPVK